MRLPVIQTCGGCKHREEFVDAWHRTEHSCSHGQRGDFVGSVHPDQPPPSWCPRRTGPDEAELEALREVADCAKRMPCSICNGKGVYHSSCTYCGDSTYDHICNDDPATPCPSADCRDLLAALRRLDEVRRG